MAEFEIDDGALVYALTEDNEIKKILANEKNNLLSDIEIEYPLDLETQELLKKLLPDDKNEFDYSQEQELKSLWIKVIDKSIKCLRYFDEREPFLLNAKKKPITYNLKELESYQKQYAEFEGALYGTTPYYRDHVFHSVRTWLLGLFCLLNKMNDNSKPLIYFLRIDGAKDDDKFMQNINFFERISIWSIAALCHDLGYPLEKSRKILSKTQSMMKNFIPNPNIWDNFAFNGVEDSINDYIIKFMSTKLNEANNSTEKHFLGRIQPKYYLKYTKSLEHFDHGIISAVILYKMLLYFMESDFNLNDDYEYEEKNARQFYIRREILRAMASHTCFDIYNIYITTFSSILFICDELQEWGRKTWSELYSGQENSSIKLTINDFSENCIDYKENILIKSNNKESIIKECFYKFLTCQYERYKMIFRDGQKTVNRQFSLHKHIELKLEKKSANKKKILIDYWLNNKGEDKFIFDFSSFIEASDEHLSASIKQLYEESDYSSEIELKLVK